MVKITKELKRVFGKNLVEDEQLKNHTTFSIGGPARYFLEVKEVQELIEAVALAEKIKLPYIILGAGSNVLIGDKGFDGLCIKNECHSLSFIKEKAQAIADSGVPLSKLIVEAASHDLGGLEFLYGIPGSVGGALVSNAGTFGGSIGDFVISSSILTASGVKNVKKNWFLFDYRDSRFSHLKSRPVILTTVFQLLRSRKEEILRKLQHFLNIRNKKHPRELSGGSFFKNPKVDKNWAKRYLRLSGEQSRELLEAVEKTGHIPAGWLLDQAGAKKMRIRSARVSKQHANFIINHKGRSRALEVRELASELKKIVYEKFGIMLEEEVEYKGEF